jgi:stage II sporulation protein D
MIDEMMVSDGSLVVKGKGYGHGVGMSQWGAKKLAEDNKSPEEIVSYFFNNVKVEKTWE